MRLPLSIGRRVFGRNPKEYALARPQYPDRLYARLEEKCGLRIGSVVFEIGSGTGLASTQLLARGARVHAIEPDPGMADFLRSHVTHPALSIYQSTFEEVELPPGTFDLGVCATAFHWLNQSSGLHKVMSLLRAGAWWAMWWTHFGSESGTDSFESATQHLFTDTADSPSRGTPGQPPFALDRARRLRDLEEAGFIEAFMDRWTSSLTLRTQDLVSLYNTFSPIRALEDDRRARFLDQLAEIAENQFEGEIERPLIVQLYAARKARER
jgi:SAM-dependent methyltransferase